MGTIFERVLQVLHLLHFFKTTFKPKNFDNRQTEKCNTILEKCNTILNLYDIITKSLYLLTENYIYVKIHIIYNMKLNRKRLEVNKNVDSWLDILEKSKNKSDRKLAKSKIKDLFKFIKKKR